MADSNYGVTLTKGATSVGKCMVITFPEIATGKANSTHHGSGGYAESIPTGLITLGDLTVSLILEAGVLDGIQTDMVAKSIEQIALNNGVDTMTFDGYYLSATVEPADASAPDVLKATVVIACTGALDIYAAS